MTDRAELSDRLNDVAAAVGEDATPEFGTTIIRGDEDVDRDQIPDGHAVIKLSGEYAPENLDWEEQ